MKTKSLAIAVILIGSFLLAPRFVRADPDDQWYQGRQGHWIQQQNQWRFRDRDGDEYRNDGGRWGWSHPNVEAAGPETWYQGRRGHWVRYPSGWRFKTDDGRVYRQHQQGGGWGWFDARGRDAEGGPGDHDYR